MVAPATGLVVPTWPVEGIGVRAITRPPRRFARTREAVADAALLLAIAYSLPFVILLAGAPLALVITLLLRLGGIR